MQAARRHAERRRLPDYSPRKVETIARLSVRPRIKPSASIFAPGPGAYRRPGLRCRLRRFLFANPILRCIAFFHDDTPSILHHTVLKSFSAASAAPHPSMVWRYYHDSSHRCMGISKESAEAVHLRAVPQGSHKPYSSVPGSGKGDREASDPAASSISSSSTGSVSSPGVSSRKVPCRLRSN